MKRAFLLILVLFMLVFSGCSFISKEGYVVKEYPYGSVSTKNMEQGQKITKPSVPEVITPKSSTPSTPKPNNSEEIKTGTGTITQDSKTITTEHLNFANVNVIRITGNKNVELTVGNNVYLFKDPRVDTDQTLCIFSVNGVDKIIRTDDEEQTIDGISVKLREVISARNIENTMCEFYITE